MFETAIELISQVPWYWVLVFAFAVTFIENIFPPSPSDAILLFIATFVGIGKISFISLLIASTLGSTAGFAVMYYLGNQFEHKIIESKRFSFISRDLIHKVERWFSKWGYWLVVANRFLSGTRAVIAFFVGLSSLEFNKSLALSFVSALIWNSLLIYFGMKLGDNWIVFDEFLKDYGLYVSIATLIIIMYFVVRWAINRFTSKLKD